MTSTRASPIALRATPKQLDRLDQALVAFRDAVRSVTPVTAPATPLAPGVYSGRTTAANPTMGGLGRGALPQAAQLKQVGPSEGEDGDDPLEAAATGLRGPSGQLPHLTRLQEAFGRHDLTGVRAHTGTEATEAAVRLGARGYASGEEVVLTEPGDLHTAAHEAAHVVQQRAGVSLRGGIGQAGDEYERHADAVADAVVQGRSAEALLDRYAGGTSGSGGGPSGAQAKAVQRQGGGEGGDAEAQSTDPIQECRRRAARLGLDAGMAEELACLEVLDQSVTAAMQKLAGGDPVDHLQERAVLVELRARIFRRRAQVERALETMRGPELSPGVSLMALLFGGTTVGMHVRPEYRDQVITANAVRLAGVTAGVMGGHVADRLLTRGRGLFSPALNAVFEQVRGVGGAGGTLETPLPTARPDRERRPGGSVAPDRQPDRGSRAEGGADSSPEPEPEPEGGSGRDVQIFQREVVFEETLASEQFAVEVFHTGLMSVTATGRVGLDATASLGAGWLRDIELEPGGARGRARLVVPAEVLTRLQASGALEVTGRWEGLPVATLAGSLEGGGEGRATSAIDQEVQVQSAGDGKLRFDAVSGGLKSQLQAQLGLNAEVQARILALIKLWGRKWELLNWSWASKTAVIEGKWSIVFDGDQPTLAFPASIQGDLDAKRLLKDLFSAAAVESTGEAGDQDNPYGCYADGADILGSFADFPFGGTEHVGAYPDHAVTPHPANKHLGYPNDSKVPQPVGDYRIQPGTGTCGATETADWRGFLKRRKEHERRLLERQHPDWSADQLEKAAKRRLEEIYDGMGWTDLYLLEDWQCHHIHPVNWGGALDKVWNLKYLRGHEHRPFTTYFNRHAAVMRQLTHS